MRQYIKVLFLMGLLALSPLVSHCGSAATSGGTPPVDIPTPVSRLSISSPDQNGIITVTGEAGFADGGTSITVTNTSTNSASLLDFLMARAWAQSLQTVTANQDGSFRTSLEASAGDEISISYTLNGAETISTTSVPSNQPLITTAVDLQDLAIDRNNNQALIVGNDQTDGFVFVINLSTNQVTNTFTLTGASGASRISMDDQNGIAIVIDPTNNNAWTILTESGTSNSTAISSSFDVGALANGNQAVISHPDANVLSLFDLNSRSAVDLVSATGDGGETSSAAFYVATATANNSDFAAVITSMSDGENHIILYEVSGNSLSQTRATDLGRTINCSGFVLFNAATEILVTDRDNDQVLRVNLTTDTVTPITVGASPRGIAINASDNKAYVVNGNDRTVSIIDLSNNSVSVAAQGLGLTPTESVVNSTTNAMPIVMNTGDGSLTIY